MDNRKAYRLPTEFPGYVRIEHAFIGYDHATIPHWQSHRANGNDRRLVNHLLRIAKLAGVPNDVPLVSHLRALAKQNVIMLKNRRGPNSDSAR